MGPVDSAPTLENGLWLGTSDKTAFVHSVLEALKVKGSVLQNPELEPIQGRELALELIGSETFGCL